MQIRPDPIISQIAGNTVDDSNIMSSVLVPNYEVKLLLEPCKVLEAVNKLTNAVQAEFSIQPGAKDMTIQFVDTKDRDIYTSGWSLRIRRTGSANKFELTYKKRYPLGGGFKTTGETNIGAALMVAAQDGFDSSTSFDAQVEVGHQNLTLSISRDKKVPATGILGMTLPPLGASRDFLVAEAPTEFKSTSHLASPIIYGPVLATRFEGIWKGFKLFVEVWLIRKSKTASTLEPIVEASFKTADRSEALDGRTKLADLLQSKGWFLAGESLRTKLIMERYGETTSQL
jgi:hypothetical protein